MPADQTVSSQPTSADGEMCYSAGTLVPFGLWLPLLTVHELQVQPLGERPYRTSGFGVFFWHASLGAGYVCGIRFPHSSGPLEAVEGFCWLCPPALPYCGATTSCTPMPEAPPLTAGSSAKPDSSCLPWHVGLWNPADEDASERCRSPPWRVFLSWVL